MSKIIECLALLEDYCCFNCSDDCYECRVKKAQKLLNDIIDEETPTEEEIIKEWEELGYKWVDEYHLKTRNIKLIDSINQIGNIIIYPELRLYECVYIEDGTTACAMSYQEHQLLTKTFKMLGWE